MSPPPIPPFGFEPELAYEDIHECLPPVLRDLAAKANDVFGLPPATIAAGGLAHMAAAAGRSLLIDDGVAVTAPGFNFVALSDTMFGGDWLTCLGRGWTDEAIRPLPEPGIVQQTPDARYQQVDGVPRTGKGHPLIQQPANVQPVEQMSSVLDQVILSNGLLRSPDHAVTLLQGAGDPMDEWTRLKPGMQRNLSGLLWLSWQGKLMKPGPGDPAIRGSLNCLWSSQFGAMRRAFCGSRKVVQDDPPPLLLCYVNGTARRFPRQESPELEAWKQHLKAMLTLRRLAQPSPEFALAFHHIAEEFSRQLWAALKCYPAQWDPWLHWLPGLLPRIFNLLVCDRSVSQTNQQKMPPKTEVEIQRAHEWMIHNAVTLTTWLSQKHFSAVEKLMSDSCLLPSTDSPDITDNSDLSEAILRRLDEQGPLSARELQRSFRRITAQERDEALQALKMQGLVIETQDGKLALPA
jgi:hypothetical protein